MEENKYQTVVSFVMIIVFLLFTTVLAGFIGYGKSGFLVENIFKTFVVYTAPAIGAFLIIILCYVLEVAYFKTDDVKYGNFIFFNSPGEGPSILTKGFKNPFKLFLISAIIFTILGLLATFGGQTYFGVGKLEQQFTAVDGILFNWLVVVVSENVQVFALIAASTLGLRFLARKYNWGKNEFLILSAIVVIILFIIFGYINHTMRYSGQETNMLRVIMFWGFMGLVTVVTGSFIPGYVMHGDNNTFVEVIKTSKEILGLYVFFIVAVLGLIYYYLYGRRK
jgi:hypothetical protein